MQLLEKIISEVCLHSKIWGARFALPFVEVWEGSQKFRRYARRNLRTSFRKAELLGYFPKDTFESSAAECLSSIKKSYIIIYTAGLLAWVVIFNNDSYLLDLNGAERLPFLGVGLPLWTTVVVVSVVLTLVFVHLHISLWRFRDNYKRYPKRMPSTFLTYPGMSSFYLQALQNYLFVPFTLLCLSYKLSPFGRTEASLVHGMFLLSIMFLIFSLFRPVLKTESARLIFAIIFVGFNPALNGDFSRAPIANDYECKVPSIWRTEEEIPFWKTVLVGRSTFEVEESLLSGASEMEGPILRYQQLPFSKFKKVIAKNADFSGADFSCSAFNATDFSGATLGRSYGKFKEYDGTKFRASEFWSVEFNNSHGARVDFSSADIRHSMFNDGVELRASNFIATKIYHSEFKNADLSESKFLGADIQFNDFRGADWGQVEIFWPSTNKLTRLLHNDMRDTTGWNCRQLKEIQGWQLNIWNGQCGAQFPPRPSEYQYIDVTGLSIESEMFSVKVSGEEQLLHIPLFTCDQLQSFRNWAKAEGAQVRKCEQEMEGG